LIQLIGDLPHVGSEDSFALGIGSKKEESSPRQREPPFLMCPGLPFPLIAGPASVEGKLLPLLKV